MQTKPDALKAIANWLPGSSVPEGKDAGDKVYLTNYTWVTPGVMFEMGIDFDNFREATPSNGAKLATRFMEYRALMCVKN